ncbi:hypothetical protein [Bacteroides sp.]|uniref:hypothetical protein n=1 Tax=Bacteroides sp. TaxID=29523 RepID=UPI0023CCF332|nr:hypothetical protein [Bacteroides sp.]MDE5709657.1 hypothetical protein [Bacteroides sp.]MDE6215076.1 hypothetical protein [Bacteroides sp.]
MKLIIRTLTQLCDFGGTFEALSKIKYNATGYSKRGNREQAQNISHILLPILPFFKVTDRHGIFQRLEVRSFFLVFRPIIWAVKEILINFASEESVLLI